MHIRGIIQLHSNHRRLSHDTFLRYATFVWSVTKESTVVANVA